MNAEQRLQQLIRKLSKQDFIARELNTVLDELKDCTKELAFLVLKLDNERHGK